MEKISWTYHVRNEDVLHSHGGEEYPTHSKKKGRLKVVERQGGRRKQLLDDLKETRGYWKLKEEALDHTLYRTCFGRGYGPVTRHTTEIMQERKKERMNE
jgi:hypothetical protein